MAHRSEQGSVLGFVLVGAVLAALLVGGIFVVKHQLAGNQVATGDSTIENQTDEPAAGDDSEGGASDDELKQALEEQAGDQKNETSSDNSDADENKSSSDSTDNLPATGPEDGAISLAGAGLIVLTGVAYVRSRRLS